MKNTQINKYTKLTNYQTYYSKYDSINKFNLKTPELNIKPFNILIKNKRSNLSTQYQGKNISLKLIDIMKEIQLLYLIFGIFPNILLISQKTNKKVVLNVRKLFVKYRNSLSFNSKELLGRSYQIDFKNSKNILTILEKLSFNSTFDINNLKVSTEYVTLQLNYNLEEFLDLSSLYKTSSFLTTTLVEEDIKKSFQIEVNFEKKKLDRLLKVNSSRSNYEYYEIIKNTYFLWMNG